MGLYFYATFERRFIEEGALTRLDVISIENLGHSTATQQQEYNSPMTKWHTRQWIQWANWNWIYTQRENKHVKLCFEWSFDINRVRDLKHECVGMWPYAWLSKVEK